MANAASTPGDSRAPFASTTHGRPGDTRLPYASSWRGAKPGDPLDPEACRDLARRGKLGTHPYILVWVIIVISSEIHNDFPLFSYGLAVAFTLLGAARAYMGVRFYPLFPRNPRRWYLIYFWIVILKAILWPVGMFVVMVSYPLSWATYIATASVTALAAGANISLATHRKLQLIYGYLVIIPTAFACFVVGSAESVQMGILLVLYALYIHVFGKVIHKQYWTGLMNTRLLADRALEMEESSNRAAGVAQMKSQFLANMSHELRTPLNAILGFAQILSRSKGLTGKDRENLSTINRSGEHLLQLINNVLDMSKIEAGRLTVEQTNFDLHLLLRDLERMFSLPAQKKNLNLDFDISNDLPIYIQADELKLRQVFINLLNNAMKFTKEGGITLRAGIRRNSIQTIQSFMGSRQIADLVFSVSDTGPGIEPEELQSLFVMFQQSETGRRSKEGTGLGLALCKRFVELMGGEINARSIVGKGSTFSFNIRVEVLADIVNETEAPTGRITGLADGQQQNLFLVVDDNAENRLVMIQLLESVGFKTCEAADGKEAVEQWRAMKPDLVWMDLRMPVMNGFDACLQIKAEAAERKQSGKVAILTASSLDFDRQSDIMSACDAFLLKPFKEGEVFAVIERLLGVTFARESDSPITTPPIASNLTLDTAYDRFRKVPEALITRFGEAAESADFDLAKECVKSVAEFDEVLASFLDEVIEQYRFDQLEELVVTCREPAQDTGF